jgi:hypothetical protein
MVGFQEPPYGESRITTQLIDGSDGTHLWAESFERPLTAVGIFDIQDQIAAQVAGIVADRYGIIMRTLMRDVKHGSSVQLSSYECVLKAADYIFDPSYEEYQIIHTSATQSMALPRSKRQ